MRWATLDAMPSERTRTVTWEDPTAGPAAMGGRTGLEFMRGFVDGSIPPPPMMLLMNMTIESVETGTVVFSAEPDESHYNPLGVIHGGFACSVLDTVAGCAVHTTLPQGLGYTTLELKVNFLRPLTSASGRLTATGRVVKPGKRAAFADGELVDAAGATIATATSTLLVFPLAGG